MIVVGCFLSLFVLLLLFFFLIDYFFLVCLFVCFRLMLPHRWVNARSSSSCWRRRRRQRKQEEEEQREAIEEEEIQNRKKNTKKKMLVNLPTLFQKKQILSLSHFLFFSVFFFFWASKRDISLSKKHSFSTVFFVFLHSLSSLSPRKNQLTKKISKPKTFKQLI